MNADQEPVPPPRRGAAPLHPVDWVVESGAVDDVLADMRRRVQARRRRRGVVLAAGAGAFALLAAFVFAPQGAPPEPAAAPRPPASVAVSSPERRTLADGTAVDLRPGARIAVEFSREFRRVVVEAGEAHFAVAKNPARPFVVVAGAVEVRAVGTAFTVARSADGVEVLVTEGRVAVEQVCQVAQRETLALAEAGTRVVVGRDASTVVSTWPGAEAAARLAWRVPRLEFTGTPLAEALPLINAHSRVQLVLADPALGAVRLSGILRADNVETLARLLQEEHGIVLEGRGPATAVLRRAR